jgi:microcystin-dependent protein
MEGTVGEIRYWSGIYAPRTWAFCAGQTYTIQQNTALYAILGMNFGGNGQTQYQLPDFRGRVAIGAGAGPGLTPYAVGTKGGEVQHLLTTAEMPAHIHPAIFTGGSGSANVTVNGTSAGATSNTPGGNMLAGDGSNNLFAPAGSALAPMGSNAIQVTSVTTTQGLPTVALAQTGGGQAHGNMQPYLVCNYIICVIGIFPVRN